MLGRHDVGSGRDHGGLQFLPLVFVPVVLPWTRVRVGFNHVITTLYRVLVVDRAYRYGAVSSSHRGNPAPTVVADGSDWHDSRIRSFVHGSGFRVGAVVTGIITLWVGARAEGHRHHVDALAGLVVTPVMVDVVYHPLYASQGSGGIGCPCIAHDLDIDQIGAWCVALVDSAFISGAQSDSSNVSAVTVTIVGVDIAVVAVL